MQFYCNSCRCPLQVGQTMCRCGQIFDVVPAWTPNAPSNYWPSAQDTRPAVVQWLVGLSPGVKAAAAGVFAFALAVPTIGGAISHYNALAAPGNAARAARAAEVRVASTPRLHVPVQPAAPAMPAPMVLVPAPKPKPDVEHTGVPMAGTVSGGDAQMSVAPMTENRETPDQLQASNEYGQATEHAQRINLNLMQKYEVMPDLDDAMTKDAVLSEAINGMNQDLAVANRAYGRMSDASRSILENTSDGKMPHDRDETQAGMTPRQMIQDDINHWSSVKKSLPISDEEKLSGSISG